MFKLPCLSRFHMFPLYFHDFSCMFAYIYIYFNLFVPKKTRSSQIFTSFHPEYPEKSPHRRWRHFPSPHVPCPGNPRAVAAVRGQGVADQQQRQQLRAATEALRQEPGAERRPQGFTQGCGGVEQGGPGGRPNKEIGPTGRTGRT